MPTILNACDFLEKMKKAATIDVRTPAEYNYGHIPSAINLPIFSNEERVIIGTLYKQQGKEPAILKGLEFVGPKMADIVKQASLIAPNKEILIHCWRGGMRSGSIAWLLETCGFKTYTLLGGYKSYRKHIRDTFENSGKIIILGGMTGSGKTSILHQLNEIGEQIIDLEKIARHKGSAFGALGEETQPNNEQCENQIFHEWSKLNAENVIWFEDESQRIGNINLCDQLFTRMRNAPVIYLNVDKEIRVQRLVDEYGIFPQEELSNAIQRIKKRLGGLETKQCLQAIEEKNYKLVADISLRYYDRTYQYGLSQRNPQKIFSVEIHENNPKNTAKAALELSKKIIW